jgi:hypothetical protein
MARPKYEPPKLVVFNQAVFGWPMCFLTGSGGVEANCAGPGSSAADNCSPGTSPSPISCGGGNGYQACGNGEDAITSYCDTGVNGTGCNFGYNDVPCDGGSAPNQVCVPFGNNAAPSCVLNGTTPGQTGVCIGPGSNVAP